MKPKKLRGILALVLILCALFLPVQGVSAAEPLVGRMMPDFSVPTVGGNPFTLSEALKEKEMVLLIFWATASVSCEAELPLMEEAYARCRDKAEILALPADPNDDPETLAAFAQAHHVSFPVGSDASLGLRDAFSIAGVPAVLAIDRTGKIVFFQQEPLSLADAVARILETFAAPHGAASRFPLQSAAPLTGMDANAESDAALRTYTVTVADQHGDPVPGCMLLFCTDQACAPVSADEGGAAVFSGPPDAYHVQVLRVPDGYTFDPAQEFSLEEQDGPLTLTITRQ